MNSIKTLAVKLSKSGERSMLQGHPWIFSNSIEKITDDGKAGDLCVVFLKKTNKVGGIGLYNPGSPIRIMMLSNEGPMRVDEQFFGSRIRQAWKKRIPLLEHTNAVRVIYGENDGLPGLIADLYNDTLVLKLYSVIWKPYLETLVNVLVEVTSASSVVLRLNRKLQNNKELGYSEGEVLFGELENPVVYFYEYGVNFSADVVNGHKTGYFLDHRQNRREVGERSAGKRVLDVFSYAGGFSVHALVGGAKKVTSVDISKQALEMARANAKLNKYPGEHSTHSGDAFEILQNLVEQKKQYDIVVIDPPSFAKSEKEIGRAKTKYKQLAELGEKLTAKGGLLVLASCSSRISSDLFFSINSEVLTNSGREFKLEQKIFHDVDHPIGFPEGAYLKTGYYVFSH